MKIAVIGSRNIPGDYGGVETACENLYTRLSQRGIKVLAYCRSLDFSIKKQEYKGVDVFSFPVPNIAGISTFLHCFIASILATFSDANIIHFHAQGPALFSIIPKLLAPSKKIGFTCHGLDWQRDRWSWPAKKVLQFGEIMSALNTDFRIMVSKELRKYYKDVYGVSSICINNGVIPSHKVELKNLSIKFGLEKYKYFLFVGRLVPEKALHILIQAYNQINTSLKLVIVGDSPETPEYVNYLKHISRNNPNIIFTSYLRGRDKAEAYSNALTYVSTSALEGHPIAVLEAMAYSLPILVSDIPPHQEILDFYENNPLPMFKSNDIEGCRQALLKACDMPIHELKQIGQQSQAIVMRHFNWENITDATKDIYLNMTNSEQIHSSKRINKDDKEIAELKL